MDANLHMRKFPRDDTVLLTLSDRKCKRFIFAARKRICQNATNDSAPGPPVNHSFISYNYATMNTLKEERKRRHAADLNRLKGVYSFEGKVHMTSEIGTHNGKTGLEAVCR